MARKIAFFERWSWFKFNNLGLALGTNLKFCTSVAKGLKLEVRKFWGPNLTFVEVTGEKLIAPPILNRVKHVLRYFIIDNSYKLLITFQRADVYLNEPIEINELVKLTNQ